MRKALHSRKVTAFRDRKPSAEVFAKNLVRDMGFKAACRVATGDSEVGSPDPYLRQVFGYLRRNEESLTKGAGSQN